MKINLEDENSRTIKDFVAIEFTDIDKLEVTATLDACKNHSISGHIKIDPKIGGKSSYEDSDLVTYKPDWLKLRSKLNSSMCRNNRNNNEITIISSNLDSNPLLGCFKAIKICEETDLLIVDENYEN